MFYDDHSYCQLEGCGLHLPDCWCFTYRSAASEVARKEWLREDICPGGVDHGLCGEGIVPTWPRSDLHLYERLLPGAPVEVVLAGGERTVDIPLGAEFTLPAGAESGTFYVATVDGAYRSGEVTLGQGDIVSTPLPGGCHPGEERMVA